MRFFDDFKQGNSQMKIWAPVKNQIAYNEDLEKRVWNHRFWLDYYNETDIQKREEMFESWVDPFPDREGFAPGNTTDIYEEVYGEQGAVETERDGQSSSNPLQLRDWDIAWAVEAKQKPDG